MNDSRKRFFFWLGVFVLPLFWSWFTLLRGFTLWQRFAAFSWLGIFVFWLVQQREALADQWFFVDIATPVILGWLTVALTVWFFFRTGPYSFTFIEGIVLIDLLAAAHPPLWFMELVGKPFDWHWLIPFMVIVLAHLALEPVRILFRK